MNNSTCRVDACERGGKIVRGMCNLHYQRDRKRRSSCAFEGCANGLPNATTGYCGTHHNRLLKHGDPSITMKGKAHRVQVTEDGMRVCKRCSQPKPASEYHKDSGSPDGLRAQCKPCRNGFMQNYYLDAGEDRRAYMRNRRTSQPDIVRALDLARYERDKDKRIALATEAVHIRRARMMDAQYDKGITDIALRKIHGDNCCYCGVLMDFVRGKRGSIKPERATVEHILPISKGGTHTWGNTTLACHRCNTSKNAKTVDEWGNGNVANWDIQVEEPKTGSAA